VCSQRIVLIRAQRPRHKTISCIGQSSGVGEAVGRKRGQDVCGCIYLFIFPITAPIITNTTTSVRNTTSVTTSVRNGSLIGAVLPFQEWKKRWDANAGKMSVEPMARGDTLDPHLAFSISTKGIRRLRF